MPPNTYKDLGSTGALKYVLYLKCVCVCVRVHMWGKPENRRIQTMLLHLLGKPANPQTNRLFDPKD